MGVCLLLTVLLAACGPSGNHFRIDGKFRDMKQGELYIYNLDGDQSRFDTLQVKDGRFVYAGATDLPTAYILVFPNAVEQVIFVGGGQTLKYDAAANDLKNYAVEGNEENELMNDFREQISKADAKKTLDIAERFIKENIASPVSIYLFHRYFAEDETADKDRVERLLKPLLKQHPDNLLLLNISGEIKQSKNGQSGKKLPKVDFTTQRDKKFNLGSEEFLSRRPYTLVTFWATWMPSQWEFLNTLRDEKDNEKLQIVAVALNNDTDNWQSFIRPDSLTIHHTCDGMAWQNTIVRKLNITRLPTYIIADKTGTILHRGTDLKAMTREIKQLDQ